MHTDATAAQARAQIREWLAVPHLGEYLRTMTDAALEEFSRVREFPLDVARAAYEREMGHSSPQVDTVHHGPAEPFTKVPAALLGRLLDHGKDSQIAVHMLAIQLRDGLVLNDKRCKKDFGISEGAFQAGLRLMKRTEVL
jgi:hypothetical protein